MCSRCNCTLTEVNASRSVLAAKYGRCRSCENEHTKARQRTLAGRYNLGKSQAKHNKHKWELSFEEYAAIVASGECFYCGRPLPEAAAGLDRKMSGDYTWDNVLPCCARQPRVAGPRGCNEIKSNEIAPIILFVRRWYEKYEKLPNEKDFENRLHSFECERNRVLGIIREFDSKELLALKRAESVKEFFVSHK